MHFTWKDFKRYIFFILVFIWFILFSHLLYIYIWKLWEKKPVKWWVIIEWIVKNDSMKIVNPVPYLWNNYFSKYLQSLIFRWCLNSQWKEDLCKVSTNDDKTFYVELSWDNYWSDDRKITLDDIYFTYNDIILNNSLWLKNPIPNNIESIKKTDDNIVVVFKTKTINNKSLFKNYILPKHILKWKDKDYLNQFVWNLVNSTCVKLDNKSDYVSNIIFNYQNCKDYYINKYQFILFDNEKDIIKLLTWKIDLYNWYENFDNKLFKWFKIRFNKRYVLFWNTKKENNSQIKTYLSKKILEWLKSDINISKRIDFNWYWLFQLSKWNSDLDLKKLLSKDFIEKKKAEFEKQYVRVKDIINYKQWQNAKYFVKDEIEKYLTINAKLWTWNYDKVWVSANWNPEYFPKSYNKTTKTFKYLISEKFKNIKDWTNTYTIYAYSGENKNIIWKIEVNYKKLNYPEFKPEYSDFVIVFINSWLTKLIWEKTSNILSKIYPWKVIPKSVNLNEYKDILSGWNYDLVISSINFEWKDISPIFKTNDSVLNPSNFVNVNFSSLINQNLLSSTDTIRWKVFQELNKIYQENIPVVFIWNEKMYLYIKNKYSPKTLDYSYFENRKKFIKSVVLKKVKQASLNRVSVKWFINFLKEELNAK